MRSLHILFILVVVTWLGFPLRAQEAISIGTRHTLFSHVLNEVREYWVYVPAIRPGEKEESYPVLYLLDGDSFFHSVVGFTRLFSTSKVSSLPPCIVVAVLNTDRTRDFTPTCSAARRDGTVRPGDKPEGGGAGQFCRFLTESYARSRTRLAGEWTTLVGRTFLCRVVHAACFAELSRCI